ncbi:acetyl-CoA synthetase-like protein [Choiromyces venosus 120613-1]|uniref:Acetyl-CoA synthetase-like protein n=1 Tax=Choiromyces venosus 120613-1 TaxID=1336337 RepID=A0A3N4K3F5_9PEZI|nr:acetyl-CoA synthetase-like protein [Choiromyces venosus 120613-1]
MGSVFFKGPTPPPIPTKDILSWIFDEPRCGDDRKVFIDANNDSRCITFGYARSTIRKLIKGLKEAGIEKGDCVLIHSFNDIYYPLLGLAIIGVGGVFAGSNPSYTPRELVHHLTTSQTRIVISEPEMLVNVRAAIKELPEGSIKALYVFNPREGQSVPAREKSWEELLNAGEEKEEEGEDWVRFDNKEVAENTVACRLFSSGTSGLPKAVEVTHYGLIAQHELAHEYEKGLNGQIWTLKLPMFHIANVPLVFTSMFRMPWTGYVLRRFDMETWLSTVQKYKATHTSLAPIIAVGIVKSPLTDKFDISSLRMVASAASALNPDVQRMLIRRIKPVKGREEDEPRVTQLWGMTETTCIVTKFNHPEVDDTGSVGKLIPGLEARIVDDEGTDISDYNVTGEICLRGPIITRGYFGNPDATRASWDLDGFYHTGDVGYCDRETKKWYLIDRKKELIKVRGFQVAPAELEGVLLTHPQILDAAVIGVVLEEYGSELPRAYVVLRPGTGDGEPLDEDGVKGFVKSRVATYKRLEGGVVFVDAIPKNATGKVLKGVLREWAGREIRGSSGGG